MPTSDRYAKAGHIRDRAPYCPEGHGEVRIVHEKCEHFRAADGQIVRSTGMVHDITSASGGAGAAGKRRAIPGVHEQLAGHCVDEG